jgi:RHS repeat-associated protein
MSPVTKPRGPVNPYGKVTAHSGTTTTQLQYNGQYSDPESGLLNLRARYYDPGTE